MVWKRDLNSHTFLRFYFFVYSLVLVSIEKIYQTLEAVFHHISKHLEFVKNTPLRVVFSIIFSVFGNEMKQSRVDILFKLD